MPSTAQPRILLLSAYDAGSHQRWREQLVASQPDFDWEVLALPPRFFRWRIRGNALTWLQEPALKAHYDLLVVTSMVDLASLKGFHPHLARTPTILYMHENQFAYPDSGRQHSSAEPKIVNLYSAVAADKVLFNSAWNRDSFLDGARRFLEMMPDGLPDGLLEGIGRKSQVPCRSKTACLLKERNRSTHSALISYGITAGNTTRRQTGCLCCWIRLPTPARTSG